MGGSAVSSHSALPCSEQFKQTSSIIVEPAAAGLRPAPVMRASGGRACGGKLFPAFEYGGGGPDPGSHKGSALGWDVDDRM